MRQRRTELGNKRIIMQKSIFYAVVLLTILVVGGMASCSGFASTQASGYHNKGVALSNEGKYDDAIAQYNKAIEIDPNHANSYVGLGYCYLMKKEYDLAITNYTKGINLNPGNVNAYNGRGAAYLNTKQYELAVSDFRQSAQLDPGQDQVNKNLDYAEKMLASSDGSGILIKTLTGEWVKNGSKSLSSGENQPYGLEMFDGMGSYWFYDVVLSATEDSFGNFKGNWTQTLLKVSGPATSLEGAEKYWKIGVPDKYSVTGTRNILEVVRLDFGGRNVHLKFTGDGLSGVQKYYDYGSPVNAPKFYEERHPELGSSYIEWTYTINLKRK